MSKCPKCHRWPVLNPCEHCAGGPVSSALRGGNGAFQGKPGNGALQGRPSGNGAFRRSEPAASELHACDKCACGCGRAVKPRPVYASPACRKRAFLAKREERPPVE